ncbi:hypothetical protein JCM10449v2_004588 [Rhodotorula kratochvilovae]
MSAKPHKFWPSKGSVWQHWSDLLLATELAALRAGLNKLLRAWDKRRPNVIKIRCIIDKRTGRDASCRQVLIVANPVDQSNPSSGSWRVSEVRADHLDAQRHTAHTVGIGTSRWLKDKPDDPISLKVGDRISGFRSMHTVEASIAAQARREGRFITVHVPTRAGTAQTMNFSCVLNAGCCDFLVRFREVEKCADGEPQWECVEIRAGHTCETSAKDPQPRLTWRMDFFPTVALVDGWPGARMRRDKQKHVEGRVIGTEQYLGFHPVREHSATAIPDDFKDVLDCPRATSASPALAPLRTASISPAPVNPSPAPPSDTPPPQSDSLVTAEADLAAAEAAAAKLKTDLAAAETLVEVQRKRVEKKRKKLARAVEKGQKKKDKVKEGGRKRRKGEKGGATAGGDGAVFGE